MKRNLLLVVLFLVLFSSCTQRRYGHLTLRNSGVKQEKKSQNRSDIAADLVQESQFAEFNLENESTYKLAHGFNKKLPLNIPMDKENQSLKRISRFSLRTPKNEYVNYFEYGLDVNLIENELDIPEGKTNEKDTEMSDAAVYLAVVLILGLPVLFMIFLASVTNLTTTAIMLLGLLFLAFVFIVFVAIATQ